MQPFAAFVSCLHIVLLFHFLSVTVRIFVLHDLIDLTSTKISRRQHSPLCEILSLCN